MVSLICLDVKCRRPRAWGLPESLKTIFQTVRLTYPDLRDVKIGRVAMRVPRTPGMISTSFSVVVTMSMRDNSVKVTMR